MTEPGASPPPQPIASPPPASSRPCSYKAVYSPPSFIPPPRASPTPACPSTPSLLPPSPHPSPHTSLSSPSSSTADQMTHLSVFCAPKAGMSSVDTSHVNRIVYSLSKDSLHFKHQQSLASKTALRIQSMQRRIAALLSSPTSFLSTLSHRANQLLTQLESTRDLTHTWLHIDLDSFYASVELLTRPDLIDKPVAVGSLSMITTSNYIARQFGVRSAMPGFIAVKLCPDLIFIPCNFDKYKEVASRFRRVFAEYDPQFESASLDEAYLDITDHMRKRREARGDQSWDDEKEVSEVAAELRRRVYEATGLTCSCGIAVNRMLAKIATDINKPNGQFYLPPTLPAILSFLSPLAIRKIPGIGKVQERVLHEIGIREVGEMRGERFAPLVVELFSEGTARWLFGVSLGLGRVEHEDEDERRRKSVSCERTFRDIDRLQELEGKVEEIARGLVEDVERAGVRGRTVTLKMKTVEFEVKQRSVTVKRWVKEYEEIKRLAMGLLKEELNLLLAGKRIKEGKEGKEGKEEKEVKGRTVGRGVFSRSPFDGLLSLRLMGIRLSSLEVEGGEEEGGSILKFAKRVEQMEGEGEVQVKEEKRQEEEGRVKRRKGGDGDISRYFGIGPSEVEEEETSGGEEVGGSKVRKGERRSRRSIVDFFHQAASSSAGQDEEEDEIEELMMRDGGDDDDWSMVDEHEPSTVDSRGEPAPAPASDEMVVCPVCGEGLGVKVSNLALNEHVDRCLRGKGEGGTVMEERRSTPTGLRREGGKRKAASSVKQSGVKGKGKGQPPSALLVDWWQRKEGTRG